MILFVGWVVVVDALLVPRQAVHQPPKAVKEGFEELQLFTFPTSPEEVEILESTEEALRAVSSATQSEAKNYDALWDAMFWSEFGDESQLPPRVQHFLRAHRIVSLALSGRNRSELACRPSRNAPLVETDIRRASALVFYAGLGSTPLWDLEPPAWVMAVAAAIRPSELPSEAFDRDARSVVPGYESDERLDEYLAEDMALDQDLMTTASGQYGELIEEPPDETAEDDDDAIATSFRELEELDSAFFGDPVEEEVVVEMRGEEPPEKEAQPDRHGQQRFDLAAYFRKDPHALRLVPEIVAKIRESPRRVSVVKQAPHTRTPLYSDLDSHVLTCYVKLEGTPDAGLALCCARGEPARELGDQTALVVDTTYLHALYNDADTDAFWLVVDLWHPDLTPAETQALARFFKLDEQFALRRRLCPELVDHLLATETPLDFVASDI
ncbi:hypothetical protein CTAYLR_006755 [Chrysophaeum taylorii]|uniref:Aspartyl/asparaginy/proline hydroxylase domain-containing protein n=1 Tax=Chrysophaeum taylorii TaxID=2483200 RepID=A0AAD7XMW6_9STRA|nr:hypothetical protein CTAYLR_006755 [Chrysophaeum taylorii]